LFSDEAPSTSDAMIAKRIAPREKAERRGALVGKGEAREKKVLKTSSLPPVAPEPSGVPLAGEYA